MNENQQWKEDATAIDAIAIDAIAIDAIAIDERAGLLDELAIVQQQLQGAVHALYSPFTDLARSQLARATPLRRAAVVLATGVRPITIDEPTMQKSLRQQRIDLATALEMLNIALAIHQLLLSTVPNHEENPNQRSITGSVILTGDYCFTQSALFAAKTDNVEVVDIFSQTLKQVSEGMLRHIFAKRNGTTATEPFNIELALCEAGIVGAATLATAEPVNATATAALPRQNNSGKNSQSPACEQMLVHLLPLMRRWIVATPSDAQAERRIALAQLAPPQQRRWIALQQWLTATA